MMLTEKYRPTTLNNCAPVATSQQQTIAERWLASWSEPKALLISGPPGIGKTTFAHCLANKYGYTVSELNASDCRNAAAIAALSAAITTGTTIGQQKQLFILDEIDGLSASDRGGLAALCKLIPTSASPIICICNDYQKIKTIAKYCCDIKWPVPSAAFIANQLLTIAKKEKIPLTSIEANKRAIAANGDLRAAILTMNITNTTVKDTIISLDPFSATNLLFRRQGTIVTNSDLVFVDYDLVPLLVQQNYLTGEGDIHRAARAASMLSNSDILHRRVYSTGLWTAMPEEAALVAGAVRSTRGGNGFLQFPLWLGKNSNINKRKRLLKELPIHSIKRQLRIDALDPLRQIILGPLSNGDIVTAVDKAKELKLTRDDVWDTLADITLYDVIIPTKTKTAFTKALNKGQKTSSKKLSSEMNKLNNDDLDELNNEDLDE